MAEKIKDTTFSGLLTPLVSGTPDSEAAALATLRRAGNSAALEAGLPSRKVEQWKFTNLNAVARLDWSEDSGDSVSPVPASELALEDAFEITLVNGRVQGLDQLKAAAPKGVEVLTLEEAASRSEAGLGELIPLELLPMAALNTARFADGLVLRVAPGAMVDRIIHLRSYSRADGEVAIAHHPRIVLQIGDGARADFVESHDGSGTFLSNPVVEICVGAKAHLGHHKILDEGQDGFHTASGAISIDAAADYDGFVLHLGKGLARNELRVAINGEQVEARVNGAYIGTGTAHIDNTTFIDHVSPKSTSREVYKGVLADTARGVFQGKILVRPDAQQTDGHQLNRALLLSPGAEIDSKPELEIYADDVQCSHGATAGELDEDQLFYLQARGIEKTLARAMLVQAFLTDSVEMIQRDAVRDAFVALLETRLSELFEGRAL